MASSPDRKVTNDGWEDLPTPAQPVEVEVEPAVPAAPATPEVFSSKSGNHETKWDGFADNFWFEFSHLQGTGRQLIEAALALRKEQFTLENTLKLYRFLTRVGPDGFTFGGGTPLCRAVREFLQEQGVLPAPPPEDKCSILEAIERGSI
jgi:hypothetical protein